MYYRVSYTPVGCKDSFYLDANGSLTQLRLEAKLVRVYADADKLRLRSAGKYGNGDWQIETVYR